MAEEITKIKTYMARKLHLLLDSQQEHAVRAELANMRRGVGKKPGELPELWGMLLGDLPEELYGEAGRPSRAEWAVYSALVLFALHQQGNNPKTHPMHRTDETLGRAVRRLAPMKDSDEFKRIQRKFNIAAVADDMEALTYRLRGIVQLLRGAQLPLDYVRLAVDLYLYQIPDQRSAVRLNWGEQFYRTLNETADDGKEDSNV